MQYDPKLHVKVVGKQGIAVVDKGIEPIPATEFYGAQGHELPPGLDKTVVYPSAHGAVHVEPVERKPWTPELTERAKAMAGDLAKVIDDRGRYRGTLNGMADALAVQSGWDPGVTERAIVAEFTKIHGKDVYQYQKAHRAERDNARTSGLDRGDDYTR